MIRREESCKRKKLRKKNVGSLGGRKITRNDYSLDEHMAIFSKGEEVTCR